MFADYILVVTATILFSLEFLFVRKIEEENGTNLKATLSFSFYKSFSVAIIMLVISGFKIQITLISVLLAALFACVELTIAYFGLKAMSVTNLSVYSVFMMLGGMLLPFLLGVVVYNEELTVGKIICCVLIFISLILNCKKTGGNKKAIIYYVAIFILNGLLGVISTVHQSLNIPHASSEGFMLLSALILPILSGSLLLIIYRRIPLAGPKSLFYYSGYGSVNGIGNLFLLIALINLPASVQYPLVTGGVMLFTTLIGAIRREKITVSEYIAAAIALAASIIICF